MLVCIVAVVQWLPGQLIAGRVDQAKSQWAAGEAAAVLSFQQTVHTQQRPELLLSSSPESGVFLQHLCRTTKAQDCHHQGSVFNTMMTAVETVSITQSWREKRRASLGHVRGKETDLTRLSTQPRGYRTSLVSTVGAQPAETWCPKQGSGHPRYRILEVCHPGDWTCDPRCRVWGLCGSHCTHSHLDPVCRDPMCALYLSVSGPLWDFQHLNWGCCLTNPRSFFSSSFVAFTWGPVPIEWVAALRSAGWKKTFGGVTLTSQHIICLIHRVAAVWFPLDWIHVICNLLLFYIGGRLDFQCFVCLRCTETPETMNQLNLIRLHMDVYVPILFLFFPHIGY